jgi:hypothetical protein
MISLERKDRGLLPIAQYRVKGNAKMTAKDCVDQPDHPTQLRKLEERIQELEEMVCLAKAKCKDCGATLIILPTTKYLRCDCGEYFGDADILLSQPLNAAPANLEWIHKAGYEKVLLLSYLRREINEKFPRVLANTRIPS